MAASQAAGLGHLAVFLCTAAVGIVGLLAWNLAATGHPLRFPFSLLEPQDTLGFGVRRLYPSDVAHHFGPGEGFLGVIRHGALLLTWIAGGLILLVVALVALLRHSEGALRALAMGTGAAGVRLLLLLGSLERLSVVGRDPLRGSVLLPSPGPTRRLPGRPRARPAIWPVCRRPSSWPRRQ
ncbi:MAG: hypothetical protein ACRDV9_02575 [Acidimicrobiia bacterium]